MKNIKKIVWFFILLSSLVSNAQKNKKVPQKKKNTCTTFVYNLTTDKSTIRDICFFVEIESHFDMNSVGRKWEKKYDYWKFNVTTYDNEKLKKSNFNVSFYIYEDNSEFTQYHCIYENHEIKALIYDKTKGLWEILVLQNEEYKILSSYSGYHYTNAFNIKTRTLNDGGY
ncbi:hypothetical protein [Flavobacterium lacustre]|uniref:hypothetical protein n=1 Tax=Flavobacterium lacustre TaxID=3016339 RepID=UPI0022B5F945|nr:hypothetical protein [Flavobacterium lacustre]